MRDAMHEDAVAVDIILCLSSTLPGMNSSWLLEDEESSVFSLKIPR